MSRQKNLKRNLLICLLAGSAVMYTLPLHAATSVVANNALPQGGQSLTGNHEIPVLNPGDLEMTIKQDGANGIIKWNEFNVGGSATVNFEGNINGYNTLNYVNGSNMSQIYGTINANNNGNIYIVNPAGVQIGNSAQINVGSLHVSNKKFSDAELNAVNANTTVNAFMQGGKLTNAELMSLGNINITNIKNGNVIFEGNRIVIDTERIKNDNNKKLAAEKIIVNTSNEKNVVIGYEAYEEINGYKHVDTDTAIATVNNNKFTKADGYMWVEDVEQLQAINTNLGGNYALRNSIDATSTSGWSDSEHDTKKEGFLSIGIDDTGKVTETNINNEIKYGFYGNFDGIDYNIFGLTINREDTNNVGLFGVTHDANISNVTLVGGSITGQSVVGSVVGAALGSTHITNATNSASVTGTTDVGGIVGASRNEIISDGNNGTITVNANAVFKDLINTGTIKGTDFNDNATNTSISNTGGLIGYMHNGSLNGNSYNLGDVSSEGHNVGGLVGHAVNSTIGNPSVVNGKPVENVQVVYNRLDVEGAYNVGGIVGNMEGTIVQNAENSGNVTATGYTNGTYSYHSAHYNGVKDETVNVANVGGIAGKADDTVKTDGTVDKKSDIKNVTNSGNVNSSKQAGNDYYDAGNVGGIVGSAVDTNISNATNKENEVRGAHNVGGVAGYFGGSATITGGINDGGDIMATGARNANEFVKETVRPVGDANESFIIGNIGGVVGYLEGDNVYVTGSANRGTVHTDEPADPADVKEWQKAANVGGVVGKIDRNKQNTLNEIKNGNEKAAVTNSYNTGDVLGYTGVGGVIGMMYNGAVSGSYNLGTVNTTRQVDRSGGSNIDPLNMGGIVGDTTEETNASAIIYDVYNKGQIGDEEFKYYARHVGGIVGRLSGAVEKAYNTGDIYNNDTVVGGIAGWWYSGTINNAFNTGNITAITATELQVGGLVGAAGANATSLTNAYNLGTIRGYQQANNQEIYLGGIVGKAANLRIDNVYTLGNLYAGRGSGTYNKVDYSGVGYIYGGNSTATVSKAYYITAEDSEFSSAAETGAERINFDNRYDKEFYTNFGFNTVGYEGSDQNKGYVSADGVWRIYDDSTTPILNAFLPNTEGYFSENGLKDSNDNSFSSIQYGTAYDPLLTIINTDKDLSFKWNELGIGGAGSLVVYGGGLTLDNVSTSNATGGSSYYGGVLYSDGALTIKGNENENLGFGSASELYGSEVTIKADGTVTIYGDVTATGNAKDDDTTGNVTINAGDVNVYGTLTSATEDKDVSISGIASQANGKLNYTGVNNPEATMPHIGDRFTYTTQNSTVDGNIIINAGTKLNDEGETVTIGSGNVNLYYGNKEEGLITTGGNLTVTGEGDVYVDSDLDIGGNLTLTGNGENSEVVLDLTNIGQVQAKNGTVTDAITGLHGFMHHFIDTNANINLKAEKSKDTKITVDMWDGNGFNLMKFNSTDHDFKQELDSMNVTINDNKLDGSEGNHVKNYTYIWVSDGDQLQAINNNGTNGLSYNYALKNDINASDVENYVAIGTGIDNGFTGTFDGRGNRIIGLKVSGDDAGIFSTIGEGGTVKNVNIYSGNFEGTNTAGAVAGMNSGRIENVTGFGNTVTVTGENGNAGGIVGVNKGDKGNIITNEDGTITLEPAENEQFATGIIDVESIGSVIAEGSNAVAGGLVGTNEGALGNSYSDSAVTSTFANNQAGLGGVVGVNTQNGDVQYVDSLGVTNGGTTGSSNVGGVIGINNGNMYSGYNESIVSGSSNVGGIIGQNNGGTNYTVNTDGTITWNKGTVENVVNATSVTSEATDSKNTGGLVGTNTGSVTNGRNNGTITGNNYVGGLVGDNADEHSILTNLVNDSSAEILGEQYVGGIAGSNSGTITADKANNNLINRGSITGYQYVGGVAGLNTGVITNTNNDVELYVNTSAGDDAKYFGGVVGQNGIVASTGTEANDGIIENATNTNKITAPDADYVGGIVGWNTSEGKLIGMGNSNEGEVIGGSFVGGVIGQNDAVIGSKNAAQVGITNEGIVIATQGGAGGLIGENNAAITNTIMTNKGEVHGNIANDGSGTGGLIGTNNENGDITYSSMINEVTGTVTGVNNVGGLIGVNKADITGGRVNTDGTDAGMYINKIYNNGVIEVGSYTDANDDGKYEFTASNGQNIGGLFGANSGKVEAAYNTGAINASGSTNVGGIAGANSGTLDQVFNTVMTETGSDAIIGGNNVGGLVGTNSGTLSNAYNTTMVNGAVDSTGNLVGINKGTVQNVYGNGKLLGNSQNGTLSNAYNISTDGDWELQNSYDGFDFEGSDTKSPVWKIYEDNGNPLLKVFLTDVEIKVDVNKINEYINNVYNGNAQAITDEDIDKLIAEGAITASDDFTAYNNAKELINSISHTNAGKYSDWLYSQQIASSGNGSTFNPNNLGYDIALTADIDTAKLTINLGEVTHTYGTPNTTGYNGNYKVEGWINANDANDYTISIGTLGNGIDDDALKDENTHTKDVGEYTWSTTASISANGELNNYEIITINDGKSKVIPVTVDVNLNGVTHIYGDLFNSNNYAVGNVDWVNGDNYTNADVVLSNINDGAFTDGNGGKTNDVKADGYKWQATVSGNGVNADTINKNYEFNVIDGDSKVTPKEVTIEDILASIEYGSKGDFTVENTGNISGTVYDDNLGISYTDTSVIAGSEYALNQNGRDTADVKVNNGVYTDSISINGIKLTGDKAGNYYISSDTAKGDIRVDKAQIHIGANNEEIHVGEAPDYTGTDINGALVNGDKLSSDYHYGVADSATESVVDIHNNAIGVWIGNTFYDLSATVDWTQADSFFSNYEVTYKPGTLTVTDQVLPDLPDNWPNNRWDYLFGDNPFDRNENFRERKAELNFVDGAMEI